METIQAATRTTPSNYNEGLSITIDTKKIVTPLFDASLFLDLAPNGGTAELPLDIDSIPETDIHEWESPRQDFFLGREEEEHLSNEFQHKIEKSKEDKEIEEMMAQIRPIEQLDNAMHSVSDEVVTDCQVRF